MSTVQLLERIHQYYEAGKEGEKEFSAGDRRADLATFIQLLEKGELRAAEKRNGEWQVNSVVKEGILLAFRYGKNTDYSHAPFTFADLDTYAPRQLETTSRNIRIIPGGSSVRAGAYLGEGVIIMPPAFVNVGGYVDDGTMVDSHALVGSCAQIGKGVHLSAGVQIGGVLEPIGQTPVIVEDGAMIGGNCGLYEGVRVGKNVVMSAGCNITASTPVYDLVHERILRASEGHPLEIPENAVVVMGTRGAKSRGAFAAEHKLHLPAALIVKYRDDSTDAKTQLEELLR